MHRRTSTGRGKWHFLTAMALCAAVPCSTGWAQDEEAKVDAGSAIMKAPMSPPIGSHRILSGEKSARIPFRMNGGDIVLDVEVNGAPLVLGLDNGCLTDELFLYGGPRLEAVGLKNIEELTIGGSGKGEAPGGFRFAPVDLKLPGIEILAQPGVVTDPSAGFAEAFGEDGIIGGSVFKHFVVRIDFDAMELVLTEPAAFAYEGEGARLPITRLASESYTMPVTVELLDGTRHEVDLGIDLGGIRHLLLFDDGLPGIKAPADAVPGLYGRGMQGDIPGRLSRIASIELGHLAVASVPTWFVSRRVVRGMGRAGMNGLPLLRLFNTTWDYGRRHLYLEPTKRFGDGYFVDLADR